LTLKEAQAALAALTPAQRLAMDERRRQDAARLRDARSSIPFYAERAKAMEEKTGDPLAYWMDLMASHVNLYRKT
jgi:hypothetical protein